jgi:protocatechuate 3,4-dioxygenase beta subunit
MNAARHFLRLVVDRDNTPDPHDWLPPLDRRAALKMLGFGAVSAVGTMVGCGGKGTTSTTSSVSTGTTATSTTLTPSATSTTSGTSVTLAATVSPAAATGSVTFYNGTTSLGSATLSSGSGSLTTSFSGAGTESLTAVYAGSSTYAASTSAAVTITVTGSAACGTATKAVTEGPYWESDSASGFYRSDILSSIDGTNTQTGVPLALTIYVYDRDNSCTAMQNVQVDIWHCNAAGIYSDIQSSTNGNGADYTSQNWLRGYQLTDTSGKVEFSTIISGWYEGRTAHIHMRFRSTYDSSADGSTNTMQLFFDQTFIDNLDTTASPYSSDGKNSVTNADDSIYTAEGGTTVLSLSGSASAGYTASFSIYLPLS